MLTAYLPLWMADRGLERGDDRAGAGPGVALARVVAGPAGDGRRTGWGGTRLTLVRAARLLRRCVRGRRCRRAPGVPRLRRSSWPAGSPPRRWRRSGRGHDRAGRGASARIRADPRQELSHPWSSARGRARSWDGPGPGSCLGSSQARTALAALARAGACRVVPSRRAAGGVAGVGRLARSPSAGRCSRPRWYRARTPPITGSRRLHWRASGISDQVIGRLIAEGSSPRSRCSSGDGRWSSGSGRPGLTALAAGMLPRALDA